METSVKTYPRLLAALRDRCLLTTTEAESAIKAVAAGASFGGSEAVEHFGGPETCVRHAFRQRAVARRYSGNPLWAGWASKPIPAQSRQPTWNDRISQMEKIGAELAGISRTAKFDLRLDCGTVLQTGAPDTVFIWFLREDGTDIENLSLPRGKETVLQIVDMTCWKAIYRVDLQRGLVLINAQQARQLAHSAKPYKAHSGFVSRPDGKVLAYYDFHPIRDRYGAFDCTVRLEGFDWSLSKVTKPVLARNEMRIIEKCILDALVTDTNSLFSKIQTLRYRVAPNLQLDSEPFSAFLNSPNDARFTRLWFKSQGETSYSQRLPVTTAEEAKQWMDAYKALVRGALGDLRGVRFGIECATPTPSEDTSLQEAVHE